MKDWRRRTALALLVTVAVVLVYAVAYRWGMRVLESRPVSMVQSVQFVVEAITTAGFGGHAPWSTDAMNALVLAMNLTGVALVFLALPVFVSPLLRQRSAACRPGRSPLPDTSCSARPVPGSRR